MSSSTPDNQRPEAPHFAPNQPMSGGAATIAGIDQSRQPKPLSCTNCRQRKVRCDKSDPCAACKRAGVECVFPNRTRVPRGRRSVNQAKNAEITRRIRRLEGLIEKFGALAEEKDLDDSLPDVAAASPQSLDLSSHRSNEPKKAAGRKAAARDGGSSKRTPGEDLDRYMSSSFWKNLSNEIVDLRLNATSDEEDEEDDTNQASATTSPPSQSEFLFTSISSSTDTPLQHPSSRHITLLFDLYFTNIDPIYKILHKPTLELFLKEAVQDLGNIPGGRPMEALMFVIYFASINSLTKEQCVTLFEEERSALWARSKQNVERALVKADLLNSTELPTLQAFVIFLICLRTEDESRSVWSLVGLAVRIGHSFNLHRDGDGSALPPFKAELRRRLWWQLCVLDLRASEDRGSDPMIFDGTYDTEMPLHINDVDINPQSLQKPVERSGFCDATFCRTMHELCTCIRTLNYVPPGAKANATLDLQGKVDLILCCQRHIEENYLVHCNTSIPIHWSTSVVARLIMSRLWLVTQYPFQRNHGHVRQPGVSRELLLQTALEVMESAYLLETKPDNVQWAWMARTFVQWHALAVTLAEVCVQTNPLLLDRAWALIDVVYQPWSEIVADSSKGLLWRPIKTLYAKAQAARRARRDPAQALKPPIRMYQPSIEYPVDAAHKNVHPKHGSTPRTNPRYLSIGDTPDFGGNVFQTDQPQQAPFLQGSMADDLSVPQLSDEMLNSIDWMEWDAFIQDTQIAAESLQFDELGQWPANAALSSF